MSSQTFTPTNPVDMSNERFWGGDLGMMDWDSTRIVFTKRTLVEFLKYTGVTIDTNFTNINKLPRYATFGKLSEGGAAAGTSVPAPAEEVATTSQTASPAQAAEPTPAPAPTNIFRPSRRVRTAPGGETHDIFGFNQAEDDALASAPPPPKKSAELLAPVQEAPAAQSSHVRNDSVASDEPAADKPAFRPSRRVRERPGGKDNISDILFGPL